GRAGSGGAGLLSFDGCLRATPGRAAAAAASELSGDDAPALLCDAAASAAAARTGVPEVLLRAIARVETGRARAGVLQPWPWAVNVEGAGRWFATRQEAEAHLQAALDSGRDSADAGCFQMNHRWHGTAFASPAAMFDPQENALQAALFLRRLHDSLGSWEEAAPAYHSRTPVHAARYRARLEDVLAASGAPELASLSAPGPMAGPSAPPDPQPQHGAAAPRTGPAAPASDRSARRGSLAGPFLSARAAPLAAIRPAGAEPAPPARPPSRPQAAP
ncbi:MAG: transglycosylase SLT domain-containing protein, partial [Rhodobacteraceae bacterium]|nr:transglycosylase SLT domain-containing protein [Paracoccaceae bacterium]